MYAYISINRAKCGVDANILVGLDLYVYVVIECKYISKTKNNKLIDNDKNIYYRGQ